MKFLLILFMVAVGFTLTGKAESSADTKSVLGTELASERTCRIIFPERAKNAPEAAYLYDGKKSHQVRLPSANFSKVIDLPSGELTVLLSSTEITDPTIIPPSATELQVEESVRDFYILVSSDITDTESPLKLRLIDASDEKISIGDTLWINSTDHEISAKLGEQDVAVSPKSETVSKSPISTSGYYKAEFRYQPNAKGDFYKITEQQWWHDPDSKHIGFIVDSGGRLPKIYYFRDFRL